MSDPPIRYSTLEARSILRESSLVDPWFLGRFGLNLYRGCEHACTYCDGRAERYYVDGDFERDIVVKTNAGLLVARELKHCREPGFLCLGGGVSDSYQPAEAQFRLARAVLAQAAAQKIPVHVLTKSALVERDLDLLSAINRDARAILSFSLQTTNDELRAAFEPRAATVRERLRLLAKARALGLSGGIMAMPLLPGLSDSTQQITDLVQQAADHGAQYVCFGGLTLRPGRQKDHFYALLHEHWPDRIAGYDRIYGSNLASGSPDARYSRKLIGRYAEALARPGLPARIPREIFRGFVPLYTEASVLLEHVQTAAQLRGEKCHLWSAGQSLARWAKKRLSPRQRRTGIGYHEIELEFVERLKDGSLCAIDGVTAEALLQLRQLGFDRLGEGFAQLLPS